MTLVMGLFALLALWGGYRIHMHKAATKALRDYGAPMAQLEQIKGQRIPRRLRSFIRAVARERGNALAKVMVSRLMAKSRRQLGRSLYERLYS